MEALAIEVDSVTLPGALGEMTVLPGHTALMSTLEIGVLSYRTRESERSAAVNSGFVEVLDDNIVVLAETCETSGEIDVSRAQAALERARDRLRQAQKDSSVDVARAESAIKRALVRLTVAEIQ